MQELYELIDGERKNLTRKVFLYAKIHNYVGCAPAREEAWGSAVDGLADAFVQALKKQRDIPLLNCFDDYARDPISAFGIEEAKNHRRRGASLDKFLGLIKYFRRSFNDLVAEQGYQPIKEKKYQDVLSRFFDRIEIGYCMEWTRENKDELLEELQNANRQLAFDNLKYATILESNPNPIIILDPKHCVTTINRAALELLAPEIFVKQPFNEFAREKEAPGIEKVLPWFADEFFAFIGGYEPDVTIEKDVLLGEEVKNLEIKIIKLGDNVRKFGTVVIIKDLTERKQAESNLRYMSFHDGLTGLFNRSYFEQEMQRLEHGRFDPVGIISFDLDGLKLVNDALGHQAGDTLLLTAAQTIQACFRENDVVARIGGDEFAVILPNSPAEVVERAAQRMRDAVDQHNANNPRIPLSISQGWAVRNDPAESLNKVYREADYQMYREKPWNREEFHQRFFRLYKEYGNELYHDKLSSIK